MSFSDEELFLKVKEGNELAFKQLYDKHWKRLYRFSLKLLREVSDAKDVVQEVFLALWLKRDTLEISNLPSYLYASTKYACLKRIGKGKAEALLLEKMNAHLNENNIDRQISYRETKDNLEKIIDSLPDKTMRIFKMSRYDDMSNKEIADKLKISIKAVEYHITQSIKHLRQYTTA